jgi:hypothetical protein
MSEASSIDPRQGAAVIPDAAVWRGSRRPFRAKTYGGVLHAMFWGGADAPVNHRFSRESKARMAILVCIARKVIPALAPRFVACNTPTAVATSRPFQLARHDCTQ